MFRVLNQVIRSTNLRSVAAPSVSPLTWSMSPFYLTGGGLLERELATKKLKMKTPSCLKRRFKMTGSGKFMFYGAHHSHNLSKKTRRQRQYGRRKHLVPPSFARILRKLNFKRRV